MERPLAASQRKPNGIESDSRPLNNELIAIIDDDQSILDGLSALFESLGYRSAVFPSAEEYLLSRLKTDTRCLIVDVHLRGMSGPDLQSHLIADGNCTPIVFITGRFEQIVRNRVIAAGALDYLIKPFIEKSVIDCIQKALGAEK
jgi:FixJ family two-component response regulator